MTGHGGRVKVSISADSSGDSPRRTWHRLCGIPTESPNPVRTHIEGHSSKRFACFSDISVTYPSRCKKAEETWKLQSKFRMWAVAGVMVLHQC